MRPRFARSVLMPAAALVVWFLLSVSVLGAPAAGTDADTDPLRPADTSSPRDTLQSFIASSRLLVERFRRQETDETYYRAFIRTSQTLDFSNTPEGDSWFVRGQRMALLQELLARIELPPENQIPGGDEVADGTLSEWKIPNTDITIERITEGPRSGEFLFSADTVQALDRLYRQARHLPYRSGATPGIYEEAFNASILEQERELRDRLKPVDTSSPRATFESFLDLVNRTYSLVTEANKALQVTPAEITRNEAREMEAMAGLFLKRASDTLDLSQIPAALRASTSIEATLMLKEVFDRMLLPPLDVIPTKQKIEEARAPSGESKAPDVEPFRWKVPGTRIEIVEIVDGERKGQFLFSDRTIRNIRETYNKIKDLPYRKAQFGGTELEFQSPGLSPGFYEQYISTSGYLIPGVHFFGRLVDVLPNWLKQYYGQQMAWKWVGLLLTVLLAVLAIYNLYRYTRHLATHLGSPRVEWLRVLTAAINLSILLGAGALIDQGFKFSGDVQNLVTTTLAGIQIVLAAWLAFRVCRAIAETIASPSGIRNNSSEAALMRISATVLGFLIAAGIIIGGLQSLGADLVPLLAGLGIGGLAVALAAQTTIANFIGGLILLVNKPVQVGDFCRYGEDPSADWLRIGTVEEINWMATRIRGIDKTVTTIPNAEFSNMHIVNLTKRDERLLKTTLQLRYETTPDQLRFILVRIRQLLLGHPMVSADPARTRFVAYGSYSKDIDIFCYLRCTEQNEFLAIQEDILLRIDDIVSEAGSGFAFPSQTLYLSRDGGLDDEHRQDAEAEVARLRSTDKLPFPEFEDDERDLLEDKLDYPPKGSPDHTPRADLPDIKAD